MMMHSILQKQQWLISTVFTSFVMINDGSECTFLCLFLLPQTDFRVVFSFPKNNHKDKITKMSTRASAEKNVQSL